MERRMPRALGKEGGFSLIVALMMLIVIIILGISGSQMAINEERGARNDRDRQLAFQAAEAALKDAEYEILNPLAPACAAPGELNHGRGRAGTVTCFNEGNKLGYADNCSAPPNEGLCNYSDSAPAFMNTNVDFLADAQGAGNNRTVRYGRFSTRAFPSQATLGISSPTPRFPPRYIIEWVPKNIVHDSCPDGKCLQMFRVTAMGFGANPNSQVVLQTIVSTQD